MLRRFFWLWRVRGFHAVLMAILDRLFPKQAQCFSAHSAAFRNAKGLEVGGPSAVFSEKGFFPVYPLVADLDNCNFGNRTIWEGEIKEGKNFSYQVGKSPGFQFICEATDLSRIKSESYDFILSSHVLEHTTNPILALSEWKRVLKEGGTFVLIVPHKDGTFDNRRPVTKLSHLLDDFRQGTKEDDATHLDEVLKLHDLQADSDAGGREEFVERTKRFAENRCMHHHVFNTPLAIQLISHLGLQVLAVEPFRPFHIIVIAKKLPASSPMQNAAFESPTASYRSVSPFPSDRLN